MKILRLIQEGIIARSFQMLLNVMQNLAILRSKATQSNWALSHFDSSCLGHPHNVLRVLPVTLMAIHIASLKRLEKM